MVEEPPRGVHGEISKSEPDLGSTGCVQSEVGEVRLHPAQSEDRSGRQLATDDLSDVCPGLQMQAVEGRDALGVNEPVDGFGGDDLPVQPVIWHPISEPLTQQRREVAHQAIRHEGIFRKIRGQHGIAQGDLRPREQGAQLRAGKALPCGHSTIHLSGRRHGVDDAIKMARLLEFAHPGFQDSRSRPGRAHRIGQREVLRTVVPQYQGSDVVSHGRQEFVAFLGAEAAGSHFGIKQDLDVDLMIRGVDAGRIVDEIGVDSATVSGVFDATCLRPSQVSAFASSPGPHLLGRDANRIIGSVADLGVGLTRGAYVGSDSAVPQQVNRSPQDRRDEIVRGHPLDGAVDAEGLAHLLTHRNRLQGAIPDAAALGDEGRVVIAPARARKIEEATTLLPGRGRIRGRVDEDVTVVESCHQLDVLAQQHAIAEDVTGHVADTDAGEVVSRLVDTQVGEMPGHRLPGAAGRDAHGLVVVTMGSTRGEGVTEPESVLRGNCVRGVGESGSALVSGHDEVGIVPVVAHHVVRGDDLAFDDVVGQGQQRRDEDAVALLAFLGPARAVGRGIGQMGGNEAALGARRHDDRVLDHLGLDQAEDLGTEVLGTIRPPQASSRHRTETQMSSGDPRRIDEDLELGSWGWGEVKLTRTHLEGQRSAILLPPVGADHGLDDGMHHAQDAIVIKGGDVVQVRKEGL